ncbi:MAG: 1,2-phenylacetyl-CoA epoxidase subunit PaaD, partial [Pseudomonadota bacterium]|nr:1,2-phenylacetyl-CoA epoxidase subunit PaaD [Pseudomonadota bacterium]
MPQKGEQEFAALWHALDALTDPEIPVITLREMGILRDVRRAADGRVEVVITPTYSGCPAMEQIADDVAATLKAERVDGRVVTQLAPAWTTDWMSAEAREKLRAYGIAPPRCTSAQAGEAVIQFATKSRALSAGHKSAKAAFESEYPVACPLCGSHNTTETSHFGSTACKALYRCLDCMEPFDHF